MDNIELVITVFLTISLLSVFMAYFSKSSRSFRKMRKNQIKEFKELEKNKCAGPHSWIKMKIGGENTHVCKDCYWCPSVEGFIKPHFVRAELKQAEFNSELDKYFKQKIEEISSENNMETDKLLKINEEISKIKKDFTTKWLEKCLSESLEKGIDFELDTKEEENNDV
jgi:hypothetical protein